MNYINSEILLEAGYSKCPGTISILKPAASNLFQKRFRNDSRETLYFINVYEFDYRGEGFSYQGEVYFYRGDKTFTVELSSLHEKTISDVENFYKEVFESLKCDPDHHNQSY